MSRCRYFEGVSCEVPRARPMRSRVRCQPGTGWSVRRRMGSWWMPSPACVASRPRCRTGEHSCIAQNLEALANDFGQPIEDLRQVAAGSSLDPDRGAEEANVLGYDPTLQPEQSVSRVHAQPDLLIDLPKLLSHRIRHFLSNEPNGSAQGISGSNGPRDHVEGVRKLRLEALHTTAPLVYEVDDRDAARNEAGEDAPEKSARPKPRCSAADGSTRHHDERDVCDGGPVARLGRQGGQAVRQPGPAEQLFNGSIALFDLGPEDLRRADRRSPRETGAEVMAHLGDPRSEEHTSELQSRGH